MKRISFQRNRFQKPVRFEDEPDSLFNQRVDIYKREQHSVRVHNALSLTTLISRVIFVVFALGFVSVIFGKDFSFHQFMIDLTNSNLGGFDFAGWIAKFNYWVEQMPDWLEWTVGGGLRLLVFGTLGLVYVLEFIFNFLGIIF